MFVCVCVCVYALKRSDVNSAYRDLGTARALLIHYLPVYMLDKGSGKSFASLTYGLTHFDHCSPA